METTQSPSVELPFIAIGCNPTPHSADWGSNDLVVYGGGNFVVLYDPQVLISLENSSSRQKCRIVHTLRGHKGRVNAVQWLHSSVDKTLINWRIVDGEYKPVSILKDHTDSVTGISVVSQSDGSVLLASCAADCKVNLYRRVKGEWTLEHSLSYVPRMIETVALTTIPGTDTPLLACGGVDGLIHLHLYYESKWIGLFSLSGHLDWIRSLAFVQITENSEKFLLLASASQDYKIRIWKLAPSSSIAPPSTASVMFTKMSTKESILSMHQDWVSGVSWHPLIQEKGKFFQPVKLLSASMDRTMMIWEPTDEGLWINSVVVGEVGGTALGFYGGKFSPTGKSMLAHGYNGAFHLWKLTAEGAWESQITTSGHFGPVNDIAWDNNSRYLLSVSDDKTCRAFAPWVRNSGEISWSEIARPQIHGYEINCLAVVGTSGNQVDSQLEDCFFSGADEKVIRVFEAPDTFIQSLGSISQIKIQSNCERPMGANVPPLGLSNKPLYRDQDPNFQLENQPEDEISKNIPTDEPGENLGAEVVPRAFPIQHETPPLEEHLMQSTLWPETHKLYGHPNEIYALASNRKGTMVASACKGAQPDQSAIRIWDTSTWKEIACLTCHTLTVVQLEFSHDDRYLLSASRDRQFAIFEISQDSQVITFNLIFKNKSHGRIIWSASWSFDDQYIATGSRDKTVKIWKEISPKKWGAAVTQTFHESVTAVSWVPRQRHLLAVGLEDGLISLWNIAQDKALLYLEFPPSLCHVDTIKRLAWRARDKDYCDLASGSTDGSVRIFSVYLPQ